MEKNRIELTGTIHKIFKLKTKTGGPMAKVLIKVGKNTFWVLSYGNVADAVGRLGEGDELAISGTAQMNNWKDEEGDWHNDFNAVAWTVEIDGREMRYQKADTELQPVTRSQQQSVPDQPPPDDRDLNQYDAQPGGYF